MLPLLLLLLCPAPAQDFKPLREFIQSKLNTNASPSVAVAIARDGKIIFEEGFGWADREQKIAANEHTPYSLASVSKPITATGLMILVQRGKVDLDAPINRYIAPARLTAKTGDVNLATVRRVASHTSGLPLHYQFFYEDEPYKVPSEETTIRRYGMLVTPPGERYEYSNLGFGILDYVIARVSKKPYETFMRDEVFKPLGLSHTAIGIPPNTEKLHAIRYDRDNRPIPFYDFDHRGASAVYSSAHDLVRFGMFHLKSHLSDQKAILSDTSIDRMQRVSEADGKPIPYAVGWAVTESGSSPVVSHSGGMGGVATLLTLIPSEKIAIVVLCNSATSLPADVTRLIRGMLNAPAPPRPPAPPKLPDFRPPPEWVRTWTGRLVTHAGSHPFEMRMQANGDIHTRIGSSLWTALEGVTYRDGYLRGVMSGDVKTEDASRMQHGIHITLKLRDGVLCGPASAISLPGKRAGNALTSWLELK